MAKRVKRNKNPRIVKQPRKNPSLLSSTSLKPVWQTGIIDLEGPWSWENIQIDTFFKDILPKIQNFEKMSWNEILGRNNHEVRIDQIGKQAQKRLRDLSLDDFERLVSLRLTGRQRVWGIKTNNIFKILWWDPDHKVCPSNLKHT